MKINMLAFALSLLCASNVMGQLHLDYNHSTKKLDLKESTNAHETTVSADDHSIVKGTLDAGALIKFSLNNHSTVKLKGSHVTSIKISIDGQSKLDLWDLPATFVTISGNGQSEVWLDIDKVEEIRVDGGVKLHFKKLPKFDNTTLQGGSTTDDKDIGRP